MKNLSSLGLHLAVLMGPYEVLGIELGGVGGVQGKHINLLSFFFFSALWNCFYFILFLITRLIL